jgi:glutamate racemase
MTGNSHRHPAAPGDAASTAMGALAPIGIFDSGIGGLSVLRHVQAYLPHERLLYFADAGFAPYGDKPEDLIVARSLAVVQFLLQFKAKAIVVACNTATAAAIKAIRDTWPALPVVGVEPGLKPAAAMTRTRTVGVLATDRTLASARFRLLQDQISAASGVRFVTQACIGLADQIEKGELRSVATATLLRRYVAPLLAEGADTLVLGCTHYPFVRPLIEEIALKLAGKPVGIIDTGEPVARQLVRLLTTHSLVAPVESDGTLAAFTTGSETVLTRAFSTLLGVRAPVQAIKAASG